MSALISVTPVKHADADDEAVARLIAAAPELLEVARLALSCLESPVAAIHLTDELEQKARAAIAKAEGKDQ